jgi:NADH-quinone oxidoreductase subunit F
MGYPHKSHQRETAILSQHFGDPAARSLDGWKQRGGYQALEMALGMAQGDITNIVKESQDFPQA